MVGALTRSLSAPPRAPAVRELRPEDVGSLRLSGRRSAQTMRDALRQEPGRSFWIPETLEYAVVRSWRNRPEIASFDELVAVRHLEPLVRASYERCVERGDELLLAIELESHRGKSRFERAGLDLLEEVITYEIEVSRVPRMPQKRTRLVRVRPGDSAALGEIAGLDQAAFPWLWQNSRQEFDTYITTPGVQVSLLEVDGAPVAYLGATLFPSWGHLDRIAVTPALQGRGIGRAAVILVIDSLRQQGARRVGLSTQRSNERSQRLYERLGFRRTPELDYQLYGSWCRSSGATPPLPDSLVERTTPRDG